MKKQILCFVAFIFAFGLTVTYATTYTWNNATGGNWTTASNWSPSTGYPGKSGSSDIAIINTKNITITYSGTATISSLQSTAWDISGIIINSTASSVLTVTGGIRTAQPASASVTITFSGPGKFHIGGTSIIGYDSSIAISSGAIVYFDANAVYDQATNNPHGSLINNGTLNILAGCNFKFGDFSSLVNKGSVTSVSSTFTLQGNGTPTCSINNTGTFTDHMSAFNLNGQDAIINSSQSGSSGVFYGHKSTITLVGASSAYINNSKTFSLDSASVININGSGDYVTNSGTFMAGTSNSSCTININNQPINNSTGANIYNSSSGFFYLGSTSVIQFGTSYQQTVNNAGTFTLQSDAYGSAAISDISKSQASSIIGTYNVERFLSGGGLSSNRGYRLLSSPVNQTADVAGTLASPNTFGLYYLGSHVYGGVTYPGALTIGIGGPAKGFSITNNNPTIYFYDESQTYNSRSFTLGNHVPVYAINTNGTQLIGTRTTSVPVGNGFLMYFVGPSSRTDALAATPPADVTLTANGHLNQGTIPVQLWTGATTLSYTTQDASHPFPGYNIVGNPYPCTIDLTKVISDNSASISSIYVLSAKNSPNQTYIACTAYGTSAPNQGYAVSGEGFFVTAKSTGKTLTFNESEKASTIQLTGAGLIMSAPNAQIKGPGGVQSAGRRFMAAEPQGDVLTGLYMKIERDSTTYSYCGIYFRKDWSAAFGEDDAKDMNGTTAPIVISSLSTDNIRASVNHMPDYTKGVNVRLYANASTNGQYKLKIEDVRNIDTLYDIYLLDHYKKDSLDIRRYGTYIFDIDKSDTSSYGGSRFELSVRPRPLPAYRLLSFTAQKVSGGVQVSWKTEAESDYTGFILQKQDGTQFSAVYSRQGDGSGVYTYTDPKPATGANTYRLQQDNFVGAVSVSPAITVNYNPAGATGLMNVYPNPARASISVNVATETATLTPAYKANIYNAAGQLMTQRTVNSNSWTEDVTQYTPGTYIINLTDKSGTLVGTSKFVKKN